MSKKALHLSIESLRVLSTADTAAIVGGTGSGSSGTLGMAPSAGPAAGCGVNTPVGASLVGRCPETIKG